MFTIKGQYAEAKIFATELEQEAYSQIQAFLNCTAFENSQVAIMPDCHSGKGAVIGFTATATDKIIPNVIGVDIGCGVYAIKLNMNKIDFAELDNYIKNNIPHGAGSVRNRKPITIRASHWAKIKEIADLTEQNSDYVLASLGTLGGGNHFIEINKDSSGDHWLIVHSGSRNFGLQIATFFQKKAIQYCQDNHLGVAKDLSYLLTSSDDGKNYLKSMEIAQEYAVTNRFHIANDIYSFLKGRSSLDGSLSVECIHNYYSFKDNIIRKGAISANKDEHVLIPINMRDGTIIGRGKGNKEYNNSAPHGAGRIMSRSKAKKTIQLEDYKETMKDVWSSCVTQKTIDESPMAYKNLDAVLPFIQDTVEIETIMKPVYNFKAAD